MTKPLSTAAQAVFWAFNSKFDWIEDGVPGPQFKAIAAALRAIAEVNVGTDYQNGKRVATILRSDILAIATELEAQ